MRTWRVVGSAAGLTRVTRPVKRRVSYPATVNSTGNPTRTSDSDWAGTEASSRIVDGSTIVKSAVPGLTMSPAFACRALITLLLDRQAWEEHDGLEEDRAGEGWARAAVRVAPMPALVLAREDASDPPGHAVTVERGT